MSAGGALGGAVVYRRDQGIDAIDQHSQQLVAALGKLEWEVVYVPDGLAELSSRALNVSWVLVQYNPFRYGRWGFAPRLLVQARRLQRADVRLVVMVHEAWLDMTDWRTTAMGAWQRLQLRALVAEADALLTSTQALAEALGHGAIHLPVGANIVPVDLDSHTARELIMASRPIVACLFGRDHPSRALGYAEAAIAALAETHGAHNLLLLNLGADAPAINTPEGVEVRTSGPLQADELSIMLLASDLMLLPLADGVSTRRSTLMAALAHGLAVVGLRGKNTDQILIEAADALVLTPVGDVRAFAAATVELSSRPNQMRAVGDAGRHLYEQRFDWPVAASRLGAVLETLEVRGGVPA